MPHSPSCLFVWGTYLWHRTYYSRSKTGDNERETALIRVYLSLFIISKKFSSNFTDITEWYILLFLQICIALYLKSVEYMRYIEPIWITFKKTKVMRHITVAFITKFHRNLLTSFEATTRAEATQLTYILFSSSVMSISCHFNCLGGSRIYFGL
jgi:hypothetical protein